MNWYKKALFFMLCAVLLLSGMLLLREYRADHQAAETFSALQQTVQTGTSAVVTTKAATTKATTTKATTAAVTTSVVVTTAAPQTTRDIAALTAQNSDCIGWIAIPDTEIDYPVMHTPDEPERYLRRGFFSDDSRAGVPFLDARCTLSSDCLFIHGHNLNNGTMFSSLMQYTDPTYAAAHPTIELETAEELRCYSVIAAASVSADDLWYQVTEYRDRTHFDGMLAYLESVAIYRSDVIPQYGQQLLTLSACDNVTDDGRVIIVAVKND